MPKMIGRMYQVPLLIQVFLLMFLIFIQYIRFLNCMLISKGKTYIYYVRPHTITYRSKVSNWLKL